MTISVPNLERIVETFIPLVDQAKVGPHMWADYLAFLRSSIAPLVEDLRAKKLIRWFSFLVHRRTIGLGATEDTMLYLHVRFELAGTTTFDDLSSALPRSCLFTAMHGPIDERSIAPAHPGSIEEPSVARAWALYGASSEWVLALVSSHREGVPIPLQNVAQFLHYVGNQLMVEATPIRMP